MPKQAEKQRQLPVYVRINVAEVTPKTSAPYAVISHTDRSSIYVLVSTDGSGKVLVGPLGVNYYEDGPPDNSVVYLHRWDVEARRKKLRGSALRRT